MRTVSVAVPNPAAPPTVTVDWDSGNVGVPSRPVVNIPIGVGVQGPPGPGGAAAVHTQSVAAGTWTITHSIGRRVNVAVFNTSGERILVDEQQPNTSTVVITWAVPTSGMAVLT